VYGLSRLDMVREQGHVTIVNGESDCIVLWLENFPAVGLPGAVLRGARRPAARTPARRR